MKTGIIVYVSGEYKPTENIHLEDLQSKIDQKADKLNLVASMEELHQNWLEFTRQGMKRIVCLIAEAEDEFHLRLTGQELRLCG